MAVLAIAVSAQPRRLHSTSSLQVKPILLNFLLMALAHLLVLQVPKLEFSFTNTIWSYFRAPYPQTYRQTTSSPLRQILELDNPKDFIIPILLFLTQKLVLVLGILSLISVRLSWTFSTSSTNFGPTLKTLLLKKKNPIT